MANLVPAPVLDTRNGDKVAAQAIEALPAELSDRSDSNPAVVLIEAMVSVWDKALYQINRWPRAVIQKMMAICGITLRGAKPAITTQEFTLANPQRADSVVPRLTEVSTLDGATTFQTLSDLTIAAYATPTGTVATTAGSVTVTGTSTAFVTGTTWIGYQIQIPAITGAWYPIASVSSTTVLSLSSACDVTVTGQAWNVGPVSGSTTAQATTTGASTNVGAGKLIALASSPAGVSSTTNTTAATGGRDEETAAEAVERGPTEYAARDVACSDEDYEQFAVKILGDNGRAKARGGFDDTTETEGFVSVAMLSPAWTTSSSVTTVERAAVARDLGTRSQSGVTIVDIAATVTSLTAAGSIPAAVVYRNSQYDETSVRVNIARTVNTLYSPNTYTYGRDRYTADLQEAVESAKGVDRVEVINGVPCIGTDYRTSTASFTFTSLSAAVTGIGATDYARLVAGQTILINSVGKSAHLVTALGGSSTCTISPAWDGSSGAASDVPYFKAADVPAASWYELFYANLGTTESTLPASIVVTDSVSP